MRSQWVFGMEAIGLVLFLTTLFYLATTPHMFETAKVIANALQSAA